jgi:hypothetical protein
VSGKDVQAPRVDSKDIQAPRVSGKDVQAPRVDSKDIQAPRTLAGAQHVDTNHAAKLVKEAEAACKAGDMKTAKEKAQEAIARLK